MAIRDSLTNLNAKERSRIKSEEISKLKHVGEFIKDALKVEIFSFVAIQIGHSHGVEIMARAWKNGNPIGFGKDGTVEIERFRIFNPPILVDDPLGTIVRSSTDGITGQVTTRRLREDPIKAIQRTLAHTITVVGKDGKDIVIGKVGNTTSTFFPDPNPETTTFDGWSANTTASTFADLRAGTGDTSNDLDSDSAIVTLNSSATSNQYNVFTRSFFLFDTSTIPDADTVDSATISFVVSATSFLNAFLQSVGVVAATTASNTAVANADFEGTVNNTTRWATDKAFADITADDATYTDWALNATGVSAISKTGVTKFGMKLSGDIDNTAPTWVASDSSNVRAKMAELAGTDDDPKLTVVHTGAGGFLPRRRLMGVG